MVIPPYDARYQLPLMNVHISDSSMWVTWSVTHAHLESHDRWGHIDGIDSEVSEGRFASKA